MGMLERIGMRAAEPSPQRVLRTARGSRIPVVRSGTPLELAEITWISEGISRETALSIPTVSACRNLIVGTVVQLHLNRYRADQRLDPDYLLSKPDPSTTLPATIGGTVDDLIFYGRAYWRILERDSEGFARRARWTPVRDVSANTRSLGGTYSILESYEIAGVGTVPPEDVIRFDSSLPGVLDIGGPALAEALKWAQAANRLSSVELPAGVLKNEGAEVSPDEAAEIVTAFQTSRQTNGVAFLQGISYSRENLSAHDLAMVEGRARSDTDVARLFNVPVAMVGASPSGNASALLYSNLSQQLAVFVSSAVAPHLRTVEATLSDATPRGQSVAFDVQTFLRSDPQAAADYATGLLTAGIISQTEARGLLGIPAAPTTTDLTPGRV